MSAGMQSSAKKITTTVSGNNGQGVIAMLQPYTLYAFGVYATVRFNGVVSSGPSSLPTSEAMLKSIALRTPGKRRHNLALFKLFVLWYVLLLLKDSD